MSILSLRGIEETLKHADAETRHRTLRAVTDLFLSTAPSLDEGRIEVFDTVFESLVDESHRPDLVELSESIAPVGNAPPKLVRRLANDDDILVAGPVLAKSPRLSTDDLSEIARTKGNAHMLAISIRSDLAEPLTDILVHEGDHHVARSVAANPGARLSQKGVNRLIERAESDESISASLCARPEITDELLKTSLAKAAARVEHNNKAVAAAIRLAVSLRQSNGLHDEQITAFADRGEYENLVAGIAVRTNLGYEIIENLMHPQRVAGAALVCKSAGMTWAVAGAVLRASRKKNNVAEAEIVQAHREFLDMSRATAERIVRFWQLRHSVVPNHREHRGPT